MNQEPRSLSETCPDSRETDATREFFTAFLTTISLSVVAIGIIGKVSGHSTSLKQDSHSVSMAQSNFREFAVIVSEPVTDGTTDPVTDGTTITPIVGTTDPSGEIVYYDSDLSAYKNLIAQLDAGVTPAAEVYIKAAEELLASGSGEEAKSVIKAAMNAYPDDRAVANAIIDVKAATGNAVDAWTDLAMSADTSNPEVMSRLISYAAAAGRVDETMVILGNLEKLTWTPTEEDWSALVDMLVQAGRIEDAKKAADLSPESSQLADKLEARKKMEEGSFSEAKNLLKDYIDSVETPTSEDYALLAKAYEELGDTDRATNAYRDAEGVMQSGN